MSLCARVCVRVCVKCQNLLFLLSFLLDNIYRAHGLTKIWRQRDRVPLPHLSFYLSHTLSLFPSLAQRRKTAGIVAALQHSCFSSFPFLVRLPRCSPYPYLFFGKRGGGTLGLGHDIRDACGGHGHGNQRMNDGWPLPIPLARS